MRSRASMEALINDIDTQNLDILIIQEPPVTAYDTHVSHRLWQLQQPTYTDKEARRRSLLYMNKRIPTSAYQQIKCDSPDVVAVKIRENNTQTLIFSIYIPPVPRNQTWKDVIIPPALEAIQNTIQEATVNPEIRTQLILAGDFNRHHPLWSTKRIHREILKHANELLAFIQNHKLQSMLPKGENTYWSLSQPGRASTLDLTLTDVPERVVKCQLYHDHFGSDHRATYSEWSPKIKTSPDPQPRRMYEKTNWDKVGRMVQLSITPIEPIRTNQQLDRAVRELTKATAEAVKYHTPLAKPSPYSKRWFTPRLKVQQAEVNKLRRKWQESCAHLGKDNAATRELFQEMKNERRKWSKTIKKTKAAHWKEFLDKAKASSTLWKAAKYTKTRDNYTNIPTLAVGTQELSENEDKAKALMESFFPKMAEPLQEVVNIDKQEITWEPITVKEIEKSLKIAKGKSAPGEDGLPTLVWKNIWTHVSSTIHYIFTASLDIGYHPKKWKTATIIVLRKPGKPNYSAPGAYRPISLLNTLGKLLESVIARRLAYYTEKHKLLPDTQYGGRAGRTTEQALLILANAVDRAWLRNKVVTLVSFDLKGAFNGVNKVTLDTRLEEKGIPAKARKWIQSFMEDRSTKIKFDDFQTETRPLDKAGLAQGSPLSPILFTFFNSDLVNQPVDFQGGASAYIDDYFRWRVGKSAEDNIKTIQDEDIPRITGWAKRTGSQFAREKTELIHLTRRKKDLNKGQINIDGQIIKASATAKLLGVVFDQELRWKDHVQKAVERATRTCTAISGLRQLRPTQLKQLYQACVTPIVDYASVVWHNPLKDKMHLRSIDTVQRVALVRILSSFRTVATQTLEVETYIPPSRLRLKNRAQNMVASLYSLPKDHPIYPILERAERRINAKGNDAKFTLVQSMKTMDMDQLKAIEKIDPRPSEPWRSPMTEGITIATDREETMEQALPLLESPETVIYSKASTHKSNSGAAVTTIDHNRRAKHSTQISVGPTKYWTAHSAELIAIHLAIQLANTLQEGRQDNSAALKTYTIVNGNKTALKAVQGPPRGQNKHILDKITELLERLKEKHIRICMIWIPGRSSTPGNEIAHNLATKAAGPTRAHQFLHPLTRQKLENRNQMLIEWKQEWQASSKGVHLRKIDNELPARRSFRLYGPLKRNQAYILTQLRTGHAWLTSYAKMRQLSEEDKCECGARETVVHVLIDCPRLHELRTKLREKIGEAFNNVAVMLGGRTRNTQGKVVPSTTNRAVLEAVIEFAEESERFKSRAPRP